MSVNTVDYRRDKVGQGVHFSRITDQKFKHNRLTASFVLPLDNARASDNAVVPHILRMGSQAFPDFSSLNARLAELYGASLDAGVMKFGGYQVLEVSIRFLDNRFALAGEDITGECARLLLGVITQPKTTGGVFDEKDTALQRQYIQDTIEAEINDKRPYAISQCIQEMCAGEAVAVKTFGYPQTAAAITPRSASDSYRDMLHNAPVEIFFTGSGDAGAAMEIMAAGFEGIKRGQIAEYQAVNLRPSAERLREKTETMGLNQSKLVMGMRTGNPSGIREVNAMRLFSALYGGTPFSKLFANVREKLSLCYYCSSRFDSTTKLLMVDSGVAAENKQKTTDEVMAQLEAVCRGEFTDQDFANTKLLLENSIRTTTDSAVSMEGWYMSQTLRGQNISPLEDIKNLEQITPEEVMQAAKKVTLDTVYFLTGEESKDE